MKLHFSKDWLRNKISSDPDVEVEAGLPLTSLKQLSPNDIENVAAIAETKVVQMRMALGTLVRQLRSKRRLTIGELARNADVSEDELRNVEHDPHYIAKPRLLFQLSHYFDVKLSKLAQISGATQAVEKSVFNRAIKYAAKSDDISTLSREESETLDAFVAFLNDKAS